MRAFIHLATAILATLAAALPAQAGLGAWTSLPANNGPIGVTTMMLDPLKTNTIIAAYGDKLYTYTFPTATDWDRIFDWAEAPTRSSSRGHSATVVFGGLLYVGTTAALLPLATAAGY